jgi:hypothetical protein
MKIPDRCYKCKEKFKCRNGSYQDDILNCKCENPWIEIGAHINDKIYKFSIESRQGKILFLINIKLLKYISYENSETQNLLYFEPNIYDYDETINLVNKLLKLKIFE